MSITTIILKAVISISVFYLTVYLIPWLKEKRIYNYVTIAVRAVEQMVKESGKGAEKYAIVEQWLVEKFNIKVEDVKKLIESAVYEMNLEKSL